MPPTHTCVCDWCSSVNKSRFSLAIKAIATGLTRQMKMKKITCCNNNEKKWQFSITRIQKQWMYSRILFDRISHVHIIHSMSSPCDAVAGSNGKRWKECKIPLKEISSHMFLLIIICWADCSSSDCNHCILYHWMRAGLTAPLPTNVNTFSFKYKAERERNSKKKTQCSVFNSFYFCFRSGKIKTKCNFICFVFLSLSLCLRFIVLEVSQSWILCFFALKFVSISFTVIIW